MGVRTIKNLAKQEKQILSDSSIQANSNNVIVLDLPAEQIIVDDELTNKALLRIENELIYADLDETIVLYTDYKDRDLFKICLHKEIKREILNLRNNESTEWKLASVLLLCGLLFATASYFLDVMIVTEVCLIFSWVMVWAFAEKMFFVIPKIRRQRYRFVHLFSAEIKSK